MYYFGVDEWKANGTLCKFPKGSMVLFTYRGNMEFLVTAMEKQYICWKVVSCYLPFRIKSRKNIGYVAVSRGKSVAGTEKDDAPITGTDIVEGREGVGESLSFWRPLKTYSLKQLTIPWDVAKALNLAKGMSV